MESSCAILYDSVEQWPPPPSHSSLPPFSRYFPKTNFTLLSIILSFIIPTLIVFRVEPSVQWDECENIFCSAAVEKFENTLLLRKQSLVFVFIQRGLFFLALFLFLFTVFPCKVRMMFIFIYFFTYFELFLFMLMSCAILLFFLVFFSFPPSLFFFYSIILPL